MKQKRARSQLSCTACRHGKLRCNRAAPCDQCIKRSKESACSYLPPAAKARAPQDVKGRIQHLEQLVVDLMNSRSSDGTGTTTNSGRSNSTAVSIGDFPATSRSDFSRSDTQGSSEAEKAQNEVTPPYSEENSPEAQVESLGHLRISKEGTRYVAEDTESLTCSRQMMFRLRHREASFTLQNVVQGLAIVRRRRAIRKDHAHDQAPTNLEDTQWCESCKDVPFLTCEPR